MTNKVINNHKANDEQLILTSSANSPSPAHPWSDDTSHVFTENRNLLPAKPQTYSIRANAQM